MTELQYADVPPAGYELLHSSVEAKQWDKAFFNRDSEWRTVQPGMNIIGASSRELWHMGIMALARKK